MESDDENYRPMLPALNVLDYHEPKMVAKLVQSIEVSIMVSNCNNLEMFRRELNAAIG